MKKHKYIALVLIVLLLIVPASAYAFSFGGAALKQPIGGKIAQGPAALESTIVCAASYGPFIMTPYNFAIPGPFFIRSTFQMPRVGGYLIGLYSVTPDMGTCTNPETGAPVPAFEINPYNASR